ncbi:ead/Ea22-like family protein [Salmonella enterica]
MSNIDKQALRERYSPKPAPECHICGKEMTIQRMSASRITYGCTGATYDDKGCHYADGRSIADDHYEQSRVTVVDVSDPDVLALLDELEAKDKSISFLKDQLAQLANFNPDWDKLEAATDSLREHMAELTAARKRIAELEATQGKPVMFIDGDISPVDAEKLAAVIREFNEETETPAARMARIIRENPHPTNMCDMPVAAAGKGEAS